MKDRLALMHEATMDIDELAKRNDAKGRLLSKKKLKERLEEYIQTPKTIVCGK